jgi:lipopolysaccharide transport system permease protein
MSVHSTTLIRPAPRWRGLGLAELWRYRELLYFLVWRDVKVRYKQTLLGAAWAILKPLFGMVVFTVIFDRLAQVPTDGVAGPAFYFTGLLPWLFFQDGVARASNSLVVGRNLVTKVYFPRMVMPLAGVLGGGVDLGLAGLVLGAILIAYRVPVSAALWTLPLFILLTLLIAVGVALWLSALNVAYRDVAFVTPFLLQAWMYASPVVYSASLIPQGTARLLYGLNPMAGVIQGFRWAVLGVGRPDPAMLGVSLAVSALVLLTGVAYFRAVERSFADVI